jgi:hypothetical protein
MMPHTTEATLLLPHAPQTELKMMNAILIHQAYSCMIPVTILCILTSHVELAAVSMMNWRTTAVNTPMMMSLSQGNLYHFMYHVTAVERDTL